MIPKSNDRLEDFRRVRGDSRVESEQYRIEGYPQHHGAIARSFHAEPGSW